MRPYKLEELQFAAPYFSAMDCVLKEEKAIYCSSELTSGFRLYEKLRKHRLKSSAELKKQLGDEWFTKNIWDKNVQSSNEFADSIRRAHKGAVVITPAPLKIEGWKQPDYTAFWDELIRTRVKEVYFNKNWEYSNGCTAELVGALDADVPAFDADQKPLEVDAASALVTNAIEQLEKDNLDTKKLRANLKLLHSLSAHSLTISL